MGWGCLLHTTDRCDRVCRWCMAVTSETLATSRVWAPWWTTGSRPPPSRRSLKWPDVSDHVLFCRHFPCLQSLCVASLCCLLNSVTLTSVKEVEIARCKWSCPCLGSLCVVAWSSYSALYSMVLATVKEFKHWEPYHCLDPQKYCTCCALPR